MAEEKRFPLTQDAYERLRTELEYLEGEGRLKISDEIGRARAHGDIAENAEYHAAKDQQGLEEARIRELREMLQNAEIITPDDDQVVKPGKLVTIRYPGEDPETYLLGFREERTGDHDILTPESPLGQALVGCSVGEVVHAKVPAGELEVEIVEVSSP
jgi:transcription elongation factor GreA